jgi:subtilisin family serine protease
MLINSLSDNLSRIHYLVCNFPSWKIIFILLFPLPGNQVKSADPQIREYILQISPSLLESLPLVSPKSDDISLKQTLNLPAESQIEKIIKRGPTRFSQWHLVRLPLSAENLITALQHNANVLSLEENHRFSVHALTPDDPYYSQQWYLQRIQTPAAWEKFTLDPEIVIGLIDTGIDYNHPDLQGSQWINAQEDLNKNGALDTQDLNGIDDDSNGYIDDVIGWDFTDAPRFAETGDYTDPDNDPMDEYLAGHGTKIAGVIAARTANGEGIAAIVPGLRVMNLRAGTASGYLEEDDVARAVLYAMDNGARIINMSFGDIVLSRFLRDVIEYAYSENIIVVASSGNSGTDQIHYPSGLKETISVGATDQNDQLAGFSNRGSTVDLVAPGVDILSTNAGGGYGSAQGTSFSAPMVSAAAAVLLSRNPALTVEQVRNQLKTSADDLGVKGWDNQFAAGRLNLLHVSQLEEEGALVIHSPASGSSTLSELLPVVITANIAGLVSLELDYGIGGDPGDWDTIVTGYRYQIISDTIAQISLTHLETGVVTVRLRVQTWEGRIEETRSVFSIDRTAPVISGHDYLNLLDGDDYVTLIRFRTDDITNADLFFRPSAGNEDFQPLRLEFETDNHSCLFEKDDNQGETEYYLRVVNRSGLVTIDDNQGKYYHFKPGQTEIFPDYYRENGLVLPPGFMLGKTADLDEDGKKEIILSEYEPNGAFGPVAVYEFENGLFIRQMATSFNGIPRDMGDADSDGKMEMLIGYGQHSYLLESEEKGTWPSRIVWEDSSGFWGSRICDLDRDGRKEIIGKSGQDFVMREAVGDNIFSTKYLFKNLSAGENQLGPPRTEVADLDGDGYQEIYFGDYDGDLIIYENKGDDTFEYRGSLQLPLRDATNFFFAGHIFSAVKQTLIAGTHSSDQVNYEHEFAARYWQFSVINAAADNRFELGQNIFIYGFSDLREFETGCAAGALAEPENDYVFLAPHPDLYLFRAEGDSLVPVWHQSGYNTNTIVIDDFDNQGFSTFYANNGKQISGLEAGDRDRPPVPRDFSAVPVDPDSIRLYWKPAPNATQYFIYRGFAAQALQLYDSVATATVYTDKLVNEGIRYFYALQAVAESYSNPFSLLSAVISAVPNEPPGVDTLIVKSERSLEIYFNEPMDENAFNPLNFMIQNEDLPVSSVIPFKNGQAALISFSGSFSQDYLYELKLSDLQDSSHTYLKTIDAFQIFVYEADDSEKPYVHEWHFENDRTLILRFSTPMDIQTVMTTENYRLEPGGRVREIEMIGQAALEFRYRLSDDTYHGHSGVTTYLIMDGLTDNRGIPLCEGNRIALLENTNNIDELMIYPQPVSGGDEWLIFSNIPENTKIKIYDVNGHFINEVHEEDQNGGVRWDMLDQNGYKVASGVYIYFATFDNQQKMGKFTVIR